MRVLADHARGSTMLVADGVKPSNEGRGYVLRRLIRRAMVHARRLGLGVRLSTGVHVVAPILGEVYPEVHREEGRISEVIRLEEDRFMIAMRQGMERLQGLIERSALTPQEVFYLHDTLGFPVELTSELAREQGIEIDAVAVASLMQGQRERSRASGSIFAGPLASQASQFVGYDRLSIDAKVTDVFAVVDEIDSLDVFLDRTPFYAERGGQISDTGLLTWKGGKARVVDVQVQGETFRHRVRVESQGWPLQVGSQVRAAVDVARRQAIARHHSATHLLHRALRDVVGEQASQAGSSVQPDYATFDFRFPRALTSDEIGLVSSLLNEKIRANLIRRVEELPLEQAISSGAVALFDEKYGDVVRVVSFGDWARELCGGTHVKRTGEIGMALISSDRSIGAGVRRIEIRAGRAAEDQVRIYQDVLAKIGESLKGTPAELPGKLDSLQTDIRRLDKEVARLNQRIAGGVGSHTGRVVDVDGVRVGISFVDDQDKDLLLYADHALNRPDASKVALVVGGQKLAVKVAREFSDRLEPGALIKVFTSVAGGKGGGRGQVGEGGGIDRSRADAAFETVLEWVRNQLGNQS
jgi:alanyl-tRNA synthetase